MRARTGRLDGPIVIEPQVHGDARGFFIETFRESALASLGLGEVAFVQDNHSRSGRGVVRGMHFQVGKGMGKLVRCARGAIFDVVVDLRRGSPHYGRWEGFPLDDVSHHQLWVPVGFAHGFCVTSEIADVMYRQTGYYDSDLERGIAYDDPALGIDWPISPAERVVSDRDAAAPPLSDIADRLPFVYEFSTH